MKSTLDPVSPRTMPKNTYNLAEHSPVWQHIKKEREKTLKELKKSQDMDHTKW
jgi:hypothetical protein